MYCIYDKCDIWRLNGGEFTDLCFLVRNAVQFAVCFPTFLRTSHHSCAGENRKVFLTVANYLPNYILSQSETTQYATYVITQIIRLGSFRRILSVQIGLNVSFTSTFLGNRIHLCALPTKMSVYNFSQKFYIQQGVLQRTNVTTNKCYNEQMLQRTNVTTNECYNKRMLQRTKATKNECYSEQF